MRQFSTILSEETRTSVWAVLFAGLTLGALAGLFILVSDEFDLIGKDLGASVLILVFLSASGAVVASRCSPLSTWRPRC